MAKILVIDDDEQILKLLTVYLGKDGHEIISASDGNQGLQELMSRQFDLVITDIVMPEKDGLEVLMWLSGQKVRPKVIAISGGSPALNQDYLLQLSKVMSADETLHKPFKGDQLRDVVRSLLSKS
jgi:DNA-binding response OmpR family regulator